MTRSERVEALFAAALERLGDARERFVREHAADASERDEVLSLLGHHARAASGEPFLDAPVAHIDRDVVDGIARLEADAPSPACEGSLPPLPEIEGFELLEVLGRGGMGVVYRAEQLHPRRFVALKVVDPGQSSPALLARLRREAESLGRLEHPGIARLYQAGTSDDAGARPWFAMELVAGLPLVEYAERQRLGRRERIELLARIADAVHYAHTRGVVHRDLKPANVLVVDDPTTFEGDSSGDLVRGARPKVLDFGVARLTGAVEATQATEPGRIVGTLAWMSPEQCEADGDVDARTDVYALGVMAFELLTGHRPYELAGLALAVALRTIAEAEAPPLSSFDESLRGDLDTIVAKTLEKQPERRYASAAELAADLRRHLRDEPIAARPASAVERARKFVRRHRLLVVTASAVGVVLVASLLVVTREAERARSAEAVARASADAALAAEARVTVERDLALNSETDMRFALELLDEILLASDPYRFGRAGATVSEVLVEAAERLEQRTDLRPRVRAHTCESLGRAFHGRRDPARGVRWLEEAHRTFVALDGPASRDALESAAWLALALADDGRTDDASRMLDEAVLPHPPTSADAPLLHYRVGLAEVRIARQRNEPELAVERARRVIVDGQRDGLAPGYLDAARSHLARALLAAGDFGAAHELASRLLHDREETNGPDAAVTVSAIDVLLRAAVELGRVEEAADLAERSLRVLPALGTDHEDRVSFLQFAARALREAGRFDRAAVAIDAALRTSEETHGANDATTLSLRNSRVLLWQELGRPEAEAELEELWPLCDAELGPCELTAAVASNLAQCLGARGDYERALPLNRIALEWFDRNLGPEHETTVSARAALAATLLLADRLDEARVLLVQVRDELTRSLGPEHPDTLVAANNLAVTLKRLGRLDEAEELFASLAASADRTYPVGHAHRGVARLTWALCLLEMERFDDAGALLEESLELLTAAVPKGHRYRTRALEGLIELCERTGRPDERDTWTRRLADETR